MNIPHQTAVIYGGGALLLVGGYYFYKKSHSSSSSVDANAPTSMSTAPVNADVSGITDSSGNILPQFQWPYNQLALPYNYTNDGNAQTVANNVTYLSPMYSSYPGYQSSSVQYAA